MIISQSLGKKRKTKQLKIRNIRFFKNNIEIRDNTRALILFADMVSITFEFQKNKLKNITVTQPRSGKMIYPIIIWTKIVRRVLSYKDTTLNTYLNAVRVRGKNSLCESK